jgi:deferrochelatase/peroxidase EfeB
VHQRQFGLLTLAGALVCLTVQERLNGEPLEEYIKPIGGGFFFALPGVQAKGNYVGQSLLETAV